MNPLQQPLRIEILSSPAKREKKGARFAQQSEIDEGLRSATAPHLSHRIAMGPFPLPLFAGEDVYGVIRCF